MKRIIRIALATGLFIVFPLLFTSGNSASSARVSYWGFDRNEYPGDSALKLLRGRFSFAGFWLNNPPGASSNSWAGKRRVVQDLGFGFLVVFNGRVFAQIKTAGDSGKLGASDGAMAVSSARNEGFPARTIIFLDEEEGGRLLPEQRAYLHGWADAVQSAGFRPGVYCSGIAYKEGSGATVITAEDIQQNAGGRKLTYWVTNDTCPPSPGCVLQSKPPNPSVSGVPFADAWQFTQSPRRTALTSGCAATYSMDGNCYPPAGEARRLHVDLDVAISTDPSHGKNSLVARIGQTSWCGFANGLYCSHRPGCWTCSGASVWFVGENPSEDASIRIHPSLIFFRNAGTENKEVHFGRQLLRSNLAPDRTSQLVDLERKVRWGMYPKST